VFSFHADPIINDQLPCGFASFRTAECLPVFDLLAPQFLVRGKLANCPIRAVFGGSDHDFLYNSCLSNRQGVNFAIAESHPSQEQVGRARRSVFRCRCAVSVSVPLRGQCFGSAARSVLRCKRKDQSLRTESFSLLLLTHRNTETPKHRVPTHHLFRNKRTRND
jgi:hypothetical protein